MMKLGTQMGFASVLGMSEEESYKTIAEMGFHSVDYPLMGGYTAGIWKWSDQELRSYMEERKALMNKHGIIAGQSHSPMDALWINAPETKEARLHAQIQAIKATAYLGSPYVVIHPLTPSFRRHKKGMAEAKELNMEYYNYLKPYLKEYNVKAAIENLFAWDPALGRCCETSCSTPAELMDYIDTLDSDRFVACLDVGHCVLSGQDPVNMIYALGKDYLHVTHIHDNNYVSDCHLMPGMGKLDWWGIGKALNDIGFEDVFNYEADMPYYRLKAFAKELCLPILKTYAELGKAIINVK